MNVQLNLEDMLSKINLESIKVMAQQDKLPLEVAAIRHLEFLMSKRPALVVAPNVPPSAPPAPKAVEVVVPPKPTKPTSKKVEKESGGDDPISALGLGTRAYNVVTKADKLNISTMEAFLALSEDDVTNCPGAGKAVVEEILKAQQRIRGTSAPSAVVNKAANAAVKDYIPVFKKLPRDTNGVREAIKMFNAVNGGDGARDILSTSVEDKGDFELIISVLLDRMPIQPSQMMTVKDLGKELGEGLLVIEEDRPMASFGKRLSELTVGEAQSLVDEMLSELKVKSEEVEEEDDSLLDDFFR